MRKLLFLSACFSVLQGFGQQRPHYTQYVLNNFILNPAVAGIENYTDLKISHRHQWVGLDGAPVTTYATIHGPWRKSMDEVETATTVHARGENPRGRSFVSDYTAPGNRSGIGLTILNDRTGPLNRFSIVGSYAYHIGIAPRTSLSLGVGVGAQNMTLNTNKLNFGSANPVDPAVAGANYLNRWRPDVNLGLWLYSANFFAGVAAQNIVPGRLSYAGDTVSVSNGRLVPHTFITAGYKFFVNDDVTFIPSVQARYISPTPISFDINAKFQYQDIIWAGGSFRINDGFAAMVGFNVNSTFNVGYSYDIITSRLNTVTRGTHEITLGFLLGNRYGDWCPRNLW
ncbi:MAG: type IX secretion system membrane protein PorP/SprF [Bacteroidetes bacterium]|jgi:type IX secretion system PorP/SprF family membrane protein|nr:MAG: type IX secretion system membrane protein PorP/SprF [Bacteroidota bacterium]